MAADNQKRERQKMKTTSKAVLAMLALGASAWVIIAQDNNNGPAAGQRPPRRQRPNMEAQDGPGGPDGSGNAPMRRNRPPLPLVIRALDANHDGVVDADEIANAATVLKTLDKDGDGKLSIPELMGPPPQGMGRPGQGQGDGPQGRPQRANGDAGFDGPPGPPPGDQQ